MALVLAIEPDARQATILKRIVREQVRADLVLVDSRDAAVAAITARIPDVILLTALLSPRDEEELVNFLRTLAGAQHVQTHTIPQLASTAADMEPGKAGGGLFGKLLRKRDTEQKLTPGCDPDLFADEIRTFIDRATERKTETVQALQSRVAHLEFTSQPSVEASTPHPTSSGAGTAAIDDDPLPEVPASGSAWESPFEWRPSGASAKAATPPSSSLVTNVPLAVVAEDQEEQDRRANEERQQREADERRLEAEAKRKQSEADAKREREEEERQRREEQAQKRLEAEAEAKRTQAEAETKRKKEEGERRRQEAEAQARRKREEEERARVEAEARKRDEEERKRLEADARRKRELEAEAKRKREEEDRKRRLEAEAKRKREEDERKRREEEDRKRRLEAEAKRKREEDERTRREEEERKRRLEAEAKRKREEEERKRREEEERARLEAEAKRRRDDEERRRLEAEARRKREEEERVRLEAEAKRRRDEEERKRLEAEVRRKREDDEARRREEELAAARRDSFAEFRPDHDEPKGVLRLMPLAMWARTEHKAPNGDEPAANDDYYKLISGLRIPTTVAAISYPRGCRIRRVRVRALQQAGAAAGERHRPVIVSRRALRGSRDDSHDDATTDGA